MPPFVLMERVLAICVGKNLAIFALNARLNHRLRGSTVTLKKPDDCLEQYCAGLIANVAWELKGKLLHDGREQIVVHRA